MLIVLRYNAKLTASSGYAESVLHCSPLRVTASALQQEAFSQFRMTESFLLCPTSNTFLCEEMILYVL